jgi:plastocyanin
MIIGWMITLAILVTPQWARAAIEWKAVVGAQSKDLGKQALAFLPNEVWVHVGDSITWTFATNEPHTVTFLNPTQLRFPSTGTCPSPDAVPSPNPSAYDGSHCVNSGRQASGSFTVSFPAAGNYKLICLVHANMTGAVHVLNSTETLPFGQRDYDFQAKRDARDLLDDGEELEDRGESAAKQSPANEVTAGIGEAVATGGGSNSVAVMRFLNDSIVVNVGDTVEWTNLDPAVPHTVTFGTEPANANTPVGKITVDSDGSKHAVVASLTDSVNSAFLQASAQDRNGFPLNALGVTRFRVTFTTPGVFNYICALHDDLGMVGKVVVQAPRKHGGGPRD